MPFEAGDQVYIPRLVAWPDREPILCDRDRANPPLADLLARLRGEAADARASPHTGDTT